VATKLPEVKGKKVAVVGNAASLLQQRHGSAIDECDVVVRMNRGLPREPSSQGTRTDILAFSVFEGVKDIYHLFKARYLMWMSPKSRDAASGDFLFYDLNRWANLNALLGARPSVGAMVLDFVSSLDPDGVEIYGFDFKRSLTHYQDRQHIGPHDFFAEERFCEDLARERNWSIVKDY